MHIRLQTMVTRSIGASIICLCTSLAACNNTLQPVSCLPPPGDSVTLVVTTSPVGLPPHFSWSPPCLMGEISVDSGGFGGPAAWMVSSDSNRVSPPVRYGQVSAGMQLTSSPQPLARGTLYTVSVWRWVSGTPNSAEYHRVGVASFVP